MFLYRRLLNTQHFYCHLFEFFQILHQQSPANLLWPRTCCFYRCCCSLSSANHKQYFSTVGISHDLHSYAALGDSESCWLFEAILGHSIYCFQACRVDCVECYHIRCWKPMSVRPWMLMLMACWCQAMLRTWQAMLGPAAHTSFGEASWTNPWRRCNDLRSLELETEVGRLVRYTHSTNL